MYILYAIGGVRYLSASLIVVKVHESSAGRLTFTPLPNVHKGLRKGHSVGNVVTAAGPLEPCQRDGKSVTVNLILMSSA